MRAAVCRSYGPPDVVEVDELPSPAPADDGVKVAVRSAAVNFPDVLIVADRYQVHVPTPFVPGSEFAGDVLEVGPRVDSFSPGDRVLGTTMVGAFAEEVTVPSTSLSRLPEGVDHASGAAFGVAHRTAYHVLRSVSRLQAGENLVVLGAGGGVGLAAVRLGAVMAANVVAVASSAEKLAVAAAEGASKLVDHRSRDLRQALKEELPHGADVVIDPVGGHLSEPALRSLRWGGRFVTVGYASGEIPRIPLNLVLLKGVHILGFQFQGYMANMAEEMQRNEEELMGLLAAGNLLPHIGARFGLDQAAEALGYVAEGRAIGKVIIEVS